MIQKINSENKFFVNFQRLQQANIMSDSCQNSFVLYSSDIYLYSRFLEHICYKILQHFHKSNKCDQRWKKTQ